MFLRFNVYKVRVKNNRVKFLGVIKNETASDTKPSTVIVHISSNVRAKLRYCDYAQYCTVFIFKAMEISSLSTVLYTYIFYNSVHKRILLLWVNISWF